MYKQLDCIKTLAQYDFTIYDDRKQCPKIPAVYIILNDDICFYVGQTENLRSRCSNHASVGNLVDGDKIAAIEIASRLDRQTLEVIAINALRPHMNRQFIKPIRLVD